MVLEGVVDKRLREILAEVCWEKEAEIVELEVMPDHVHLLASIDPQFGIHRLVKAIKGGGSMVLREEFPSLKSRPPSLWTNAYYVGTVGGASLEVVRAYA